MKELKLEAKVNNDLLDRNTWITLLPVNVLDVQIITCIININR